MFTKSVTLLLTFTLLVLTVCPVAFADVPARDVNEMAMKVAESIKKIGVGSDKKVEVKLRDGSTRSGYIGSITERDFAIVDEAGAASWVEYPAVQQVRRRKRILGVVILIAVIAVPLIILAVENSRCKRGTGPCS